MDVETRQSRARTARPHRARMRRTARSAAVPAALLAVVLTGCGAQQADTSAPADAPAGQSSDRGAEGGAAAAPEAGGAEPGAADGSVEAGERLQVRTAQLQVETDGVAEAAERATEIADSYGGHIEQENVSGGSSPHADLVLRVPEDSYAEALDEFAGLGERTGLQSSVEDVTEDVADVDARTASAEDSLERLRGLLDEAESVEDVLAVEAEIATRQENLESLQARQDALAESVALGTVELTLSEPGTAPADDGPPGFLAALAAGWSALVATGRLIAAVAGWLLPFAAAAALLAAPAAAWRARRGLRPVLPLPRLPRRRARRPASAEPPQDRGEAAAADSGSPIGPDGPDDHRTG